MENHRYPAWVDRTEKVTGRDRHGKRVDMPRFIEVENASVPGTLGDTLTGRRVYPLGSSCDSRVIPQGTSLTFETPAARLIRAMATPSDGQGIVDHA